jgi:membrane-bound lytic murein transglycosylase D
MDPFHIIEVEEVSEEVEEVSEASHEEDEAQSDQGLLDSALEFCQAAYDFRDQGDLDNAIDALDQAYALILKISPDGDTEILQQRDDLRITISKRIVECYSSRFTVANGLHNAIPLTMNEHVEKALQLFTQREKTFFLNAYRRSGRYRPAILKSLKEAGLPEELSWLPLIESGFKDRALSSARALGLWQFIASTGYKYGLQRDQWVDERMDPHKATEAAIAYLKELHQIFGDWTTALAAYNCGEGRVLRVIRTQKINYLDNFWDLYEKLPKETAFYVPKFLAVLHIMNDPEAHGVTLPEVDEPPATEEVVVNKQISIKAIAGHLGISPQVLADLNPSLRREFTPSRPFPLKVPEGIGPLVLAQLEDLPAWKGSKGSISLAKLESSSIDGPHPHYLEHRVRRGETLSIIARKHQTSMKEIMTLNRLGSSNFVQEGWRLKIPSKPGYASRSQGQKPDQTVYLVQKGDSLWQIAKRFGTSVDAIKSLNGLRDNHLNAGQRLQIRGASIASKEVKTRTYRVKRGDSPFQIARKHQMNLSELLTLNSLTPKCTIFPGQVLLVTAR